MARRKPDFPQDIYIAVDDYGPEDTYLSASKKPEMLMVAGQKKYLGRYALVDVVEASLTVKMEGSNETQS